MRHVTTSGVVMLGFFALEQLGKLLLDKNAPLLFLVPWIEGVTLVGTLSLMVWNVLVEVWNHRTRRESSTSRALLSFA